MNINLMPSKPRTLAVHGLTRRPGKRAPSFMNGLDLTAKAPLPVEKYIQLDYDSRHIHATAARKGLRLDRWEAQAETAAASKHFHIGCWLHHFTTLRGLDSAQYLQARVELMVRLFMADIQHPSYDFYTVFDFGERTWDGMFEEGDAAEVRSALRAYLAHDKPNGLIHKAFSFHGWSTEKESQ